jgi:glycosyltransferase involved in cell wall biosynthesis
VKIAFYKRGIAFDGSTPLKQPLGGSESSIVYAARELARCGNDVLVYSNCSMPGNYEGVEYRHYHQFFSDYTATPWDVFISFRSFDPFLLGRIAPKTIFWCGDASDQPALEHFEHRSLQENIDLVFCVSDWHRRTFIETFRLPPGKVIATRNGFCPDLIPEPAQRERTNCAYSSTPFRGLDVLLQIFPRMRARVPSLSLDVFSSMKIYGWTGEADEQEFGALYSAASQQGVRWHGSVPQPVLLDHLSRTGLFLYPNTFEETSCMAAIEAQASGCVVVTSARAALTETVEHGKTGLCLKGEPASPGYQREFIAAVTGLLENPFRMAELSHAARARAFRSYTWASIVREWTELFQDMPAKQVHARWSGPLALIKKTHDYLQKGNVSAATRVFSSLEQTPFLPHEVEVLKGKLSTWM